MEVTFEYEKRILTIQEFEKLTGSSWIPSLQYSSNKIFSKLKRKGEKLYRAGKIPKEQLWLGTYYRDEILTSKSPKVAIKWIDSTFGFGVFANQNLKKMEYLSEYGGLVRKRRRDDLKNGYLFEYNYSDEIESTYTIDALEQGGISRFFNHSYRPNVTAMLATIEGLSHVLFFTKEAIAKGDELCYDYGPNYWSKRPKPL